MIDILTDYAATDILIMPPHYSGYCACNTALVLWSGEFLFQTRYVSYMKHFTSKLFNPCGFSMNQNYVFDKEYFNSLNVRYTSNKFDVIDYGDRLPVMYRGLEDPRFIIWDDKLYVYGSRADVIDGKTCICIYNEDGETITRSPFFFNSNIEKNWMAIPDKPFHFIYGYVHDDVNGFVEVHVEKDCTKIVKIHTADLDGEIRGSTPLVKTDFGYITIVHKPIYKFGGFEYRHAFVLFDDDLNFIKISNWFVFHNNICEFCCGMSIVDDTVYITYSQLDAIVSIMSIPMQGLMQFIDRSSGGAGWHFDMDYYTKMQKSLFDSGHIESARIVSNYILTQTYDPKSLQLYMNTISTDDFLKIKYNY